MRQGTDMVFMQMRNGQRVNRLRGFDKILRFGINTVKKTAHIGKSRFITRFKTGYYRTEINHYPAGLAFVARLNNIAVAADAPGIVAADQRNISAVFPLCRNLLLFHGCSPKI